MKKIGIYKITNLKNGKSYIGQSQDIEERWKQHLKNINTTSTFEYPIYKALRKYGVSNFTFEVLEECSISELGDREIYYIDKFNSFNEGYNQTEGGRNVIYQKLSPKLVDDIIKDLEKEELLIVEIAKKYGLHSNMVTGINTGRYHTRDRKYPVRKHKLYRDVKNNIKRERSELTCPNCGSSKGTTSKLCGECAREESRKVKKLPKPELLLKKVALNGFAAVGREYGVADNTIRKWMSNYGLPTHTNEVKKLYGNYQEPQKTKNKFNADFTLIYKDGKEYFFQNSREATTFLKNNNYSQGTFESVQKGINRLLRGERKSYLGFTLKNTE